MNNKKIDLRKSLAFKAFDHKANKTYSVSFFLRLRLDEIQDYLALFDALEPDNNKGAKDDENAKAS